MIEVTTPGGKVLQAIRDKRHAAFKFQFASGGELPEQLTGIFLDERAVKQAISQYLAKDKVKKNAER